MRHGNPTPAATGVVQLGQPRQKWRDDIKPPRQVVTIPTRPRFIPEGMMVILFETCLYCNQEMHSKEEWLELCPDAPTTTTQGIELTLRFHHRKIIIVDARPYPPATMI